MPKSKPNYSDEVSVIITTTRSKDIEEDTERKTSYDLWIGGINFVSYLPKTVCRFNISLIKILLVVIIKLEKKI